jgi:hypothetical protein
MSFDFKLSNIVPKKYYTFLLFSGILSIWQNTYRFEFYFYIISLEYLFIFQYIGLCIGRMFFNSMLSITYF